jgi:membrane-bound metal-dependent hydrolase YbcI (DUF457 family)
LLLWFVGGSWLLVHAVFQSPALDYRMVAVGALLPLLDGVTGGAWVLHTLLFSVGLLGVVMVATRRRRLVRRRWLGLPIGTFMHLVLDGVWTNSTVFWWPFLGYSFDGAPLPEVDRGALSVVLELVGVAAIAWCWRRFGFDEPRVRRHFLATGNLPR